MIDKVLTVIERHDGLAEAMSQPDAMNESIYANSP